MKSEQSIQILVIKPVCAPVEPAISVESLRGYGISGILMPTESELIPFIVLFSLVSVFV